MIATGSARCAVVRWSFVVHTFSELRSELLPMVRPYFWRDGQANHGADSRT